MVDPIDEQVINELLVAIVRVMRATMIRSAYSSTVYEMMDFSCALFDPAARLVAQAEDLGSHVIPMPATVRMIMERFGEELAPKYGLATIRAAIESSLARAEARMRRRIGALPAGEYVYEDYLEYYGPD